jgi:hypothetical protein
MRGYQRVVRYGVRLDLIGCMIWWIGSCMFDAALLLLYRSLRLKAPSTRVTSDIVSLRHQYIWISLGVVIRHVISLESPLILIASILLKHSLS